MADMSKKKEVSRDTNGTIFCICLTSWIFRHFLAATSFVQTESRVWCRKGLKEVLQTIRHRWRRNQNRWILCLIETCLLWDRILKTRVTLKSRATAQTNCLQATGNRSQVAQMKVRFLRSQERSKRNTCKIGAGHFEQDVNSSGSG